MTGRIALESTKADEITKGSCVRGSLLSYSGPDTDYASLVRRTEPLYCLLLLDFLSWVPAGYAGQLDPSPTGRQGDPTVPGTEIYDRDFQ